MNIIEHPDGTKEWWLNGEEVTIHDVLSGEELTWWLMTNE